MAIKRISSQRKTLGDAIYSHLRDEIISLRLQPGEMVYESDLAAAFGVSRTPVREAFRLLVAEEFIEILPQRGARIAYISKRKVEEAWFIRESLEVSAFKKVARSWDDTEERFQRLKDQILQNVEEQKKAASQEDYTEFFHLDEIFHRMILEQANNLTLLSFIDQVRGHVNRMRYLEFHETKETSRIVADHEELFRAIQSGDEAATEAVLIRHLRQSTTYSQQLFEKNPNYFLID
jgi:DNA-binding GntR family transcriptional regulator